VTSNRQGYVAVTSLHVVATDGASMKIARRWWEWYTWIYEFVGVQIQFNDCL